jgi:hypothetical protein
MHALALLLAGLVVGQAGSSPLPVLWAPRLDGGAIRAVFVAPEFTTRDVDEVAQRLQMKATTIPLDGPDPPAETLLQDLRTALSDEFDVLVIGNINLGILPEDVLETIENRVTGGKGLVLANYREGLPEKFAEFLRNKQPAESAADIKRGVGASMTTEWPSNLDFATAGTVGKGRVVELD